MKLQCIIIDDEPSSQNILKKYISAVGSLNLIAIYNNPHEAESLLTNFLDVDIIFLDINMPKINGLDFYKSLNNPPEVIFTTAYSEHAIEAFNVSAIDYLLKPFSFNRFLSAVNKITNKPKKSKEKYLIIKSNKVIHKLSYDSIYFIEASGDYVKIQTNKGSIKTHSTFNNLFSKFSEHHFMQVHKSFAINLEKINSVSGNIITLDTYKVPIGQKYKSHFFNTINF